MTQMELYSVAKNGLGRGCSCWLTPREVRIADFYVDSEDREDWRVLIQLAVSQAGRNPDTAEVVAVGSDAVTRQALADCGFHARGSSALRLLSGTGAELPDSPIRFQMIDSDAAYLHENKNDYWA